MKKLTILAALICCVTPQEALGFGLRTHLYIAEQILEDLREEGEGRCRVTLADQQQEIPTRVCEAALEESGAFLAGAIGPDAFPDLVVGQTFVHPGTEGGRQTSDWLGLMLARAETDKEIAFAFGNVIHAAGDVFAHSYVNNYSGGVFELTASRSKDIELRHTMLEKYIDQRLKYDPVLDDLDIPAEFLVDTMVRTSYIPIDQRLTAEDLTNLFANPAGEIAERLGSSISAGAPGSHLMVMWGMLALAEGEQRATPCRVVTYIDESTMALRRYIVAEFKARKRLAFHSRNEPTLPDLSQFEEVKTPCHRPDDRELRGNPESRVQQTSWEKAIDQAQATYDQLLSLGQLENEDLATNRRNEWWQTLAREDRQELSEAFKDFESSVEASQRQQALQVFADYWADDIRTAIELYMYASLETARDMVESSAPYPQSHLDSEGGAVHYSRWFSCYRPVFEGQPVAAGRATCERTVALAMAMSLSHAARESGLGQYNRNIYYRILAFGNWIDRQMTSILFGIGRLVAPSLTELVDKLVNPKRIGRDELDKLFARAGNGQVEFRCVSDWIDADLGMMPRWDHTGFRPDSECSILENGSYAERSSEWLDPEQFVALQHAITLGKLSLLNQKGLRGLARNIAVDTDDDALESVEALLADIRMSDDTTYSILLDTVRSLDGSYQWNGHAMPYPRESGYRPTNVETARSGYPMPRDENAIRIRFDHEIRYRPGFPFYRTDDLRRIIFTKLFPEPFEGEILKSEQFGPEGYPFTPCSSDPFRPERSGEKIKSYCATTRTWQEDTFEDARPRASAP